jgi:hypothetical protein
VKRLFIATAIVTALTALPAVAQTTLRANIPFEFNVGRAVLPAGEYAIADGPSRDLISVRSTDGKHSAAAVAYSRDILMSDAGESVLAFYRAEDGKAHLVSIRRRHDVREFNAPAMSGRTVVALVKASIAR